MLMALAALCWAGAARADGEPAGDFDYYVLSLSWSAAWCALEGDDRGDPQCEAGRGLTFVLHGLWPQYEDGWPSYCRSAARDPSPAMTDGMADIMGGAGQAFHEWRKHGRCSGLSAADYFTTARRAFAGVSVPGLFSAVNHPLALPARVVEDAFLAANPGLTRDAITITCKQGLIQEARICLTLDLEPRTCADDVRQDCSLDDALLQPVR